LLTRPCARPRPQVQRQLQLSLEAHGKYIAALMQHGGIAQLPPGVAGVTAPSLVPALQHAAQLQLAQDKHEQLVQPLHEPLLDLVMPGLQYEQHEQSGLELHELLRSPVGSPQQQSAKKARLEGQAHR
jgi:hypothetical protein